MEPEQMSAMLRGMNTTIEMQARSIDRLTDHVVKLLEVNAEQARTITQQARLIEEQEEEQTYDFDDSLENRVDAREKAREEREEREQLEEYEVHRKRKAAEDALNREEEMKKARVEEQAEFIDDTEPVVAV